MIYLFVPRIEHSAQLENEPLDTHIARRLAHDAVHASIGFVYDAATRAKLNQWLSEMRASTEPTEREQVFRSLIVEEITADFVAQAVVRRIQEPSYIYNENDLARDAEHLGEAHRVLWQRTIIYAFGPVEALEPRDESFLAGRLYSYLNSDEFYAAVKAKLTGFGVFREE